MTAGATELEIAQADTGTQESTVESAVGISPALVRVMAIGCGLSVANLYYNQPLFADIGRSFHASVRQLGVVSLLTQIGYALGAALGVLRSMLLLAWMRVRDRPSRYLSYSLPDGIRSDIAH